jgi:hypothetical protein
MGKKRRKVQVERADAFLPGPNQRSDLMAHLTPSSLQTLNKLDDATQRGNRLLCVFWILCPQGQSMVSPRTYALCSSALPQIMVSNSGHTIKLNLRFY